MYTAQMELSHVTDVPLQQLDAKGPQMVEGTLGKPLRDVKPFTLAVRERAASPQARIGFHAFHLVGTQVSTPASATLQKVYRGAGLSDAFIARVSKTPPTEVWYPTTQELLENGVLTRASMGGENGPDAVIAALRPSRVHNTSNGKTYGLSLAE